MTEATQKSSVCQEILNGNTMGGGSLISFLDENDSAKKHVIDIRYLGTAFYASYWHRVMPAEEQEEQPKERDDGEVIDVPNGLGNVSPSISLINKQP